MEKHMIRLSLCIATLNRADFIADTLHSVLAQLTPEIEVVVVDGASTDGTDRVVSDLFNDRPNCHLYRLSEKGGVDRDYCRAIERATGEYCWLLTDDDLLIHGAIETVLRNLSGDVDLLVVNAEVASKDLATTLMPQRLRISRDRDFGPKQQGDLLATAGTLLSFIGAVVIRRSVWLLRDKERYIGTEFVHVGVIFQQPFEGRVRLLAEPLIRIRYGNAQWSRRAFDIWMKRWPKLIWSFPHLSTESKRKVVAEDPRRELIELVSMKVRGCFGLDDYRNKMVDARLGMVRRTAAFALAATPEVPFNAMMSLIAALLPWFPTLRQELQSSPFYFRRTKLKG
jgi:abequosyltransferase